eukprot:jgi/Mesen1/3576/ME000002S05143
MRANIVSEAGLGTRINQWWAAIPFVTSCIFIGCVAIYAFDLLAGYDSFGEVCMAPSLFIGQWQVYRLFTSILFHGGILHLVFNMMAYVPMGGALERQLGSVRYLYLLLLFAILNAIIMSSVAYAAEVNPILRYSKFLYECSIGFSGVIFALIVAETHTSGVQSRSIFGFFSVPAKWYPWVLLALFQFLMPAVSLLGHLSGIVSGILYTQGLLNWIMPSPAACLWVESLTLLAPVVRLPGFIVGGGNPIASSAGPTLPTVMDALRSSGEATSAALSRAWGVGQRYMPVPQQDQEPSQQQQQPAVVVNKPDQRFPGQGRTLAATSQPPVSWRQNASSISAHAAFSLANGPLGSEEKPAHVGSSGGQARGGGAVSAAKAAAAAAAISRASGHGGAPATGPEVPQQPASQAHHSSLQAARNDSVDTPSVSPSRGSCLGTL